MQVEEEKVDPEKATENLMLSLFSCIVEWSETIFLDFCLKKHIYLVNLPSLGMGTGGLNKEQ